jgi:phosphatidylglycerophosphate synthase
MMATARKASYETVRQSYPAWKAYQDQINSPYSYFWEPSAFRLSPFFINHGVRANTVTLLGLGALICGLVFIVLGAVNTWNYVVGVILLHAVLLLDNIDGHVARFTGQTSRLGALLDDFLTWLQLSLFPVCLGMALFLDDPKPSLLTLGISIPRSVWLTAGIVQMFVYLLSVVVGRKAEALLGGRAYDKRIANIKWLIFAKALIEIEVPLLALAALVGAISVLHLGYAVYHTSVLVVVIVRAIQDTARADGQSATEDKGPEEK